MVLPLVRVLSAPSDSYWRLINLPAAGLGLVSNACLHSLSFICNYLHTEGDCKPWLALCIVNANLPSCSVQLVICPRHRKGILSGQHIIGKIVNAYPWIVVSFLVLAMATFIFTRVRQRWCKTAALLIPPSVILILVTMANSSIVNLWGWLI